MSTFSQEELLKHHTNIRLISVIAHVDHGKTTLTDSLLARAGIIDEDQAGTKRGTDTMPEEVERGITIRSSGVTMTFHNVVPDMDAAVLHLVDSPGHVDFSSEVTAALRVSDGAIVVVDCVEGVCVQTETVLRQALTERVKPILVLNKIDRAILELKNNTEDAYQRFQNTIDSVNAVMESYKDPALGDLTFDPTKGNVVFASGLFGWGVTVPQFAKRLAAKSGLPVDKLQKYLWGDWFYDPETKKIGRSPTSTSGNKLQRYGCQMLLEPLFKMVRGIMSGDQAEIDSVIAKANITLPAKDREEVPKKLMRAIMRRFLPLADALLEPVFKCLPSPVEAQKYRADVLYEGDPDDEYAKAIRACDPAGPLVAFISKMFPVPNTKSFYAFGRIFSGTIRAGMKVYIANPSGPRNKDTAGKSVQSVLAMNIRAMKSLEYVPCGNIAALSGIDGLLVKSGTLSDVPNAPGQIRPMRFSVAPVVRVAVACKSPADLPKLVDGLRALVKVDPCVQCSIDEESGEHIVGAAGDLHMQVCLRILREEYCKGVEIIQSEPMVPFRETVIASPEGAIMVKSPNKHNRLYAKAEPLPTELCEAIDTHEFTVMEDTKLRADTLTSRFGWDVNDAKRKIWCFGPETEPTNALVDSTFGVQYMNEIRDICKGSFKWATGEGPLCGEPVRGVRINLTDCVLHADAIHRGGGQIMPTARRLVHAAMLAAETRLMEPIFLVEIQTTAEYSGNIYNVITRRRGRVIAEEPREGTPVVVLKANLPVLESFDLTEALRMACHGQAFPQCSMSHWQVVDGNPYVADSLCNTIVNDVRKRKKLPPAIPKLEDLCDKL